MDRMPLPGTACGRTPSDWRPGPWILCWHCGFFIKDISLSELLRPWLKHDLTITGCEHRRCGLQGRAPPRLVSDRIPHRKGQCSIYAYLHCSNSQSTHRKFILFFWHRSHFFDSFSPFWCRGTVVCCPNLVYSNMRAGGLLPCLGIALCLLSIAVATKVCCLMYAFKVTRSG